MSLLQVLHFIFQRGYLYTGKLGYSITPAQGGVAHEVTVSTAVLLAMPPLTEAIKGTH